MRTTLLFLLTFALTAPTLFAGTEAGVTMNDSVNVDQTKLVLNGMALRSKAIFKVYVAGLYLPAPQSDPQKVLADDTMRHMVMHWVRKVGKEKICDGWYEGLEANMPDKKDALKSDFDHLCTLMEDAKTGDRFVFTYTPGTGTSVSIAGKPKGTIKGKDFADALFASWIGPKPGPGVDFREELMGK